MSEALETANAALYERDFYAWANKQAALLRAGKLSEADVEHIAEEIESMGRAEKRELINRLAVLLAHMLKWRFQAEYRSKSWRLTIEEQRHQISRHMRDNPSLKSSISEAMKDAYSDAVIIAERDTYLNRTVFPPVCPWSFERVVAEDFWPED